MKRAGVFVGVVAFSVHMTIPMWAQSVAQVDSSIQPAVAALRALAQTIKSCPQALSSERKWGKRVAEIERWYDGPPQNVVWDVVPSSSVRSPYLGYIEFSLPKEHWVPDEVKEQFMGSSAGLAYLMALGSGGPMKYRYEFDLGPDGLDLTKMLRHGPGKDGQYPAQWFDAGPKGETCWESSASKIHIMSEKAAPTQATIGDNFLGTVGEFAKMCEDRKPEEMNQTQANDFAYCMGYFGGLLMAGQVARVAIQRGLLEVKEGEPFFCPPSTVSNGQANKVFLKWVGDHPERLHENMGLVIWEVLRNAFPCPGKNE